MHRHARAGGSGEFGCAGEQLVAGQVVADQRDPTLDETTWRKRVDDCPLPVEDLGDAADEWPLFDVPTPRSDGAADADRVHRLGDSIGVGDRARLDHGGDAVLRALDRRQGCRQLVVVAAVMAVKRHRPFEDRRARREQVGDAAAHQADRR